ncbi:hypothetical protein HPP92_012121 [Vanilla planifolia]|uniref:N-acetyltransferase domain-containing protein n=1 Tax=Vanilla planifolia TaxID=51239 RepID=A0A835R7F8_VANPL|nr:hypothetical protein HPP92_012121 [Vanilla planifolia]
MEAEEIYDTAGDKTLRRNPPLINLRRFVPSDSDIDALIALSADDHVNRFLRRGPFACRDDAHRFLHAYVLPHPWYRAICLSGAGVVGSIFLRPSSLAGRGELLRSASLGYRVAGEFWGRGIATEAVRMRPRRRSRSGRNWRGWKRLSTWRIPPRRGY